MSKKKPLPMEPVRARVDSLDMDGRGVARVNDKVVFIDGALPGEEVTFRYTRIRGRFDEGRVDEVLVPAAERAEPRCPHYSICGGCSLQHMAPDEQISFKQARLLENLKHHGDTEPETVLPPLTGPHWGYRRKARLGVKYVAKKGKVLVGFREKRSSFLADLSRCEVLHPAVGEQLEPIGTLISALDGGRHIPQIEVAVGDETTVLILRHLQPLSGEDLERLQAFAREHHFRIRLQPGGPDTIAPLIPDDAGPLAYRLEEQDVTIRFLPTDFTQVNSEINQRMVALALEQLAPQADERVLDLFCGLGNFTLPLARRAAEVVGVEGDEGLVARAVENARSNGIGNAVFHAVDLSRPDPNVSWLRTGYQKLLLDPPRTGALEIIRCLTPPYPERVVYVSCNPATLARDAGELVHNHGYRLEKVGVMDMFPHTTHVESIALFTR